MIRTIFLTSALLLVLISLGLYYLFLLHYPDNHVGFDPKLGIYLALLFAVISLVMAFRVEVPVKKPVAILLLLLTFGNLCLDRCNFLVSYDVWTKRGMPGQGSCKLNW
jgi:hypothetical protein